jgi:hypothetical protein
VRRIATAAETAVDNFIFYKLEYRNYSKSYKIMAKTNLAKQLRNKPTASERGINAKTDEDGKNPRPTDEEGKSPRQLENGRLTSPYATMMFKAKLGVERAQRPRILKISLVQALALQSMEDKSLCSSVDLVARTGKKISMGSAHFIMYKLVAAGYVLVRDEPIFENGEKTLRPDGTATKRMYQISAAGLNALKEVRTMLIPEGGVSNEEEIASL